jgi:hypothetical protein
MTRQQYLHPLIPITAIALLVCGCSKPNATDSGTPGEGSSKTANPTPAKSSIQETKPTPKKQPSGQSPAAGSQPSAETISYPRDKDRLMATVHGRKVTLEDLVSHIEDRHYTGFKYLIASPNGKRELLIPRMANWVGQYADILVMEAEARRLKIKESTIQKNQGQAYLAAFQTYQQNYQQRTQRAFPSTKTGLEFHRKAFQKDRGLGLEVEGLLNTMVPDELDKRGVIAFYKQNSESMNGYLKISQIFVKTRSSQTGARLVGEHGMKAKAKILKITKLLNKNGKNFEVIAASHSEDKASARIGGVLNNLHRFDPRMPANFCRTAWGLRNGQWKGPMETLFGTHFIKRIEWMNTKMIVNPDPDNKDIRHFVRSHRKEALIFKLREGGKVTLHY